MPTSEAVRKFGGVFRKVYGTGRRCCNMGAPQAGKACSDGKVPTPPEYADIQADGEEIDY